MSSDQSPLNEARGAGTTFGPTSGDSQKGTSAGTVGSNSAAGSGSHPSGDRDDSNASLTGSKVGPQNEDLEGEQMRAPGEGEVMNAQFDKKNAGWGEQDSLTSDLDRKKAEQAEARGAIKEQRAHGGDVDGGNRGRTENEGLSAV